MSKKVLEKFGKNLRKVRIEKNLSQEKLAQKANVHRNYIGLVERGEINLTLKNIIKIAKALKVKAQRFFD